VFQGMTTTVAASAQHLALAGLRPSLELLLGGEQTANNTLLGYRIGMVKVKAGQRPDLTGRALTVMALTTETPDEVQLARIPQRLDGSQGLLTDGHPPLTGSQLGLGALAVSLGNGERAHLALTVMPIETVLADVEVLDGLVQLAGGADLVRAVTDGLTTRCTRFGLRVRRGFAGRAIGVSSVLADAVDVEGAQGFFLFAPQADLGRFTWCHEWSLP
jgi:hypothetical protein